MENDEIKQKVAGILAFMSSYSASRILELIDYSDDTSLQLVSLLSPSHKDTLAYELCKAFDNLNERKLYNELFTSIKSVEKLIDYIYKNNRDPDFRDHAGI